MSTNTIGLGFGMYLIAFVVQSRQKGSVLSVEYCFESVEEYSEGKIHKSELETRNVNVNTVYFINQARGNILESVARSLFTMNKRCLLIFELPA